MRPSRSRRSGFALIEAVVAAALVTVGLVATMKGISAISRSQARALDTEQMQRLALRRYNELLATGGLSSGQASGDFTDLSESRFIWSAQRTATGTGNLDDVRVDVYRPEDGPSKAVEVRGFYCRPVAKAGQ